MIQGCNSPDRRGTREAAGRSAWVMLLASLGLGSLPASGSVSAPGADRPAAGGAAARDGQFDCLIEPFRTVEIRSPVTGVIDKLFVSRGSMVKQGAPLVKLDSTVESAAAELALYKSQMNGPLRSAESRVQHAESKSRRKTDLAASNFASTQDR